MFVHEKFNQLFQEQEAIWVEHDYKSLEGIFKKPLQAAPKCFQPILWESSTIILDVCCKKGTHSGKNCSIKGKTVE